MQAGATVLPYPAIDDGSNQDVDCSTVTGYNGTVNFECTLGIVSITSGECVPDDCSAGTVRI